MDWSKTKSIFIVVFLILDIFLLSLFINKISESNPAILESSKIEDKLEAENIEYHNLSKEAIKEAFISAKTKKFTDSDVDKLKNQEVTITNNNTIHSSLSDPYSFNEKFSPDELKDFMKTYIVNGEDYSFWKYNKEEGKIIYYQTYNDKPLFHNMNGQVILYLNKDNEIVSYKQTMLEEIKAFSGEKKSIFTPFQALQVFYENNKIPPESKVKKAELGFSTLSPLSESQESQVLSPTWHFVIEHEDKKEDLFLNAFEGQIIEVEKSEKDLLE